MNTYAQQLTAAQAQPSERALFIRRTYAHLAAARLGANALLAGSLATAQAAAVGLNHPEGRGHADRGIDGMRLDEDGNIVEE